MSTKLEFRRSDRGLEGLTYCLLLLPCHAASKPALARVSEAGSGVARAEDCQSQQSSSEMNHGRRRKSGVSLGHTCSGDPTLGSGLVKKTSCNRIRAAGRRRDDNVEVLPAGKSRHLITAVFACCCRLTIPQDGSWFGSTRRSRNRKVPQLI